MAAKQFKRIARPATEIPPPAIIVTREDDEVTRFHKSLDELAEVLGTRFDWSRPLDAVADLIGIARQHLSLLESIAVRVKQADEAVSQYKTVVEMERNQRERADKLQQEVTRLREQQQQQQQQERAKNGFREWLDRAQWQEKNKPQWTDESAADALRQFRETMPGAKEEAVAKEFLLRQLEKQRRAQNR